MSTANSAIACLSSSYYLRSDLHAKTILPTIKRSKMIHQIPDFLCKFRAQYGKYMVISKPANFQVKASSSPNSPSSSWKKWLLGILMTVFLPAVGYKGGLFLNLKSKIEKAVSTVEEVVEVVEEVAEEAEKIVEEVEEKLPGDSKLRKSLESLDDVAKKAVNQAKKAEDVVHKVKDMEAEIEETLKKAAQDQPKK